VERAWYVEASCSAIEWPCIHGYSCTETGWLHLMVEQCLRPSMPLQPLLLAIVRGSDSLSTNELCIRDPGRIRCSTTPFLCLEGQSSLEIEAELSGLSHNSVEASERRSPGMP